MINQTDSLLTFFNSYGHFTGIFQLSVFNYLPCVLSVSLYMYVSASKLTILSNLVHINCKINENCDSIFEFRMSNYQF